MELESESSLPPTILQEGNDNGKVQGILEINGLESCSVQVPEAESQELLYCHWPNERNLCRKHWPGDIISEYLISKRDEVDGLWVVCKVCSKASGNYLTICIALNNKEKKNPACINLCHPYQMNKWEKHLTENVRHICNMADLESMKITNMWQPILQSFFPVVASGSLTVAANKHHLSQAPVEKSLALCHKYGINKQNDSCYRILGQSLDSFKVALGNYAKYSLIMSTDGEKDHDHHIQMIANELIVVVVTCNNQGIN